MKNMKKVLCLVCLMYLFVFGLTFADTSIYMYVGEKVELDSKVLLDGEYVESSYIEWQSLDKDVATVSSAGTISAQGPGTTQIKVSLNEGTHIKEALINVSVKTTVKSVEMFQKISKLRVGESAVLTASVTPVSNISVPVNDGLKWSSTDSNVVTVDGNGKLYGKNPGKATILVKSVDGGKRDYVEITVESTVEKITFAKKEIELYIGQSILVQPQVLPESAYLKDVTWKSYDTDVVKVDSEGLITGVGLGEEYVAATTVDAGKRSSVKVKVKSSLKDIIIAEDEIKLNDNNKTHQLEVAYVPLFDGVEPFQKDLKWSSTDSAIASVDSNGKVTAKKTGLARIIAYSVDGNHKASCLFRVTITPPVDTRVFPSSIKLGDLPSTCLVGEKVYLDILMSPSGITEDKLTMSGAVSSTYEFGQDDGRYYFRPLRNLAYNMKVKTSNDRSVSFTMVAKSTVSDIKLIPGELKKVNGYYIEYLGSKTLFTYELKSKSGVSDDQVTMRDVEWYENGSIESGVNGDYLAEAENVGSATMKVKSLDSGAEDEVNIRIENMAKDIEVDKTVSVGLRYEYEPWIKFILKDDILYGYTDVLDKEYSIKIVKQYVSESFLEAEKDYEEKKLKELTALVEKREDLNANLELKRKSIERLHALESFLKKESGGYARVDESGIKLTDRDGDELKIAEIKSKKFVGYIVGKSEVEIKTKDGNLKETMTITVDDKVSELVIFDELGNIVTYSDRESAEEIRKEQEEIQKKQEEEANKAAQEEEEKKRAELKAYYEGFKPENIPSDWALTEIDRAGKYGLITADVNGNFRAKITRREFAGLVIKLYENLSGKTLKDFDSTYFTDTTDSQVIKAYNLGIVNGVGDRKFAPDNSVQRQEISVMLAKAIKVAGKELENKNLNKVFSDIDQVADWASDAVKIMSVDNEIMNGSNGKLDPKGSATREQAILLVLRVFDALK